MTCPSCAGENTAGAVFCMRCGAPLSPSASGPSPVGAQSAQVVPAFATLDHTQYGGFWARYGAFLIDTVLAFVLVLILAALPVVLVAPYLADAGVSLRDDTEPSPFERALLLSTVAAIVVVFWLYHALFLCSSRQATPGKTALGLVVTDTEGQRISFLRATVRHFATYLSGMLYIGYLMQPFTPKRQTLHDMIAGTLVVKK